jgi:RNA polymerase sigma factor (sigma-70 family)
MPREPLRQFLQHLRQVVGVNNARALDDAELLERFVSQRDAAAFEVLVWRHGKLVLDVCGRLLHNSQDIEDAFQATFLVLVRQAKGIRKRAALASWLYKVAYNVALRARRGVTGLNAPPSLTAALPAPDVPDAQHWRELKPVLDEEISQLPEKYRAAVVLCYLQGLTTGVAARQLGCAQGTIHSRLAWARARLRNRLVRRGVAISMPGSAAALSPSSAGAVSVSLVRTTIRLGLLAATGKTTGAGALSVAGLVEGVIQTMFVAKLRVGAAVLLVACALGLGAGAIRPHVLADKPPAPAPVWVPGKPDTIQLPAEMLARLGIETAEVKARGDSGAVLRLSGVLTYDPERVVNVRSRFAGEVIEIGQAGSLQYFPPALALTVRASSRVHATGGGASSSSGESSRNSHENLSRALRAAAKLTTSNSASSESRLRVGDKVSKGHPLAIISSKDLGLKQVDFLDAVARAELDQKELKANQELFKAGLIQESVLRASERQARLSANRVLAARRTLLLWKLSPEEIDSLAQDSRKKGSPEIEKRLGKIVIRAPMDGVIVESNIAVGNVTTPESIVFRIADLSRLQVVANASERDLAALQALPASKRRWTIRAAGVPDAFAVRGHITHIPVSGRPEHQGALDPDRNKSRSFGGDVEDPGKGAGAAFLDYDADGWLDLFVTGGHGGNRLYRSRGDGTFEDITGNSHIAGGQGKVASSFDLDNDGLVDLYVAGSQGGGRLYRNRGDGTLQEVRSNGHRPVIGWADNSAGRLHAGQLITATVQLPPTRQEAAIPASALVLEAGKEYVIVQPDPAKLQYVPRRVLVIRRDRHIAHIRPQPSPAEMRQGFQSVRPGERIISRGAAEVKGMVEDLRAR